MTQYTRTYQKLRRDLEKLGLDTRDVSRGGFAARLPDGSTVQFITTMDPKSLDKQRTAILRAGLPWPLDPKPRKPRNTPPLPTINIPDHIETHAETEKNMAAPKAQASPDMEIVTVTPAIAEKWLERNTTNRKLSDRVVERYVTLMNKGLWHYDGSPIRFNVDGKLIDGQHRLWAVIESGTEQQFIVLRNLDAKAFITIDTGKARSFGDILSIEYPGMKSVHNIAAVVGLVWRWEQGHRGKNLRPNGNLIAAPPEELLEFFKPNHDDFVRLQRAGNNVAYKIRGLGTSTFALLLWITERIDAEDSEFFFDRLTDGIGLEEGSPILALRNVIQRFALSKGDSRATMPTEVGVALGIKAWNAFRRGDDVKLLQYRTGGAKPEAFPEAE